MRLSFNLLNSETRRFSPYYLPPPPPPTWYQNLIVEFKSIGLFHQPTLMHNFIYSLTICLFHYYPRHVSSINMSIFRRKNCVHTASVIFVLCKRLHSTLVESRLLWSPLSTSVLCRRLQRAKIPDAVWTQFFLLKMDMLMLETCRG